MLYHVVGKHGWLAVGCGYVSRGWEPRLVGILADRATSAIVLAILRSSCLVDRLVIRALTLKFDSSVLKSSQALEKR